MGTADDDDNDHNDDNEEALLADTLTTSEAADRLGISEPRLQDLIRRRKVKRPQKVNGRRRWTVRDVEAARDVVGRNS